MILTCPSCSASYNVPNEAIGIEGRAVRCKKCKHEWFQEGEKQALEELISMVEATEINLDALSFDDGTRRKIPKPDQTKEKLSVRIMVLFGKFIPASLKNYLFSGDKRSFLSHFASFMVALAVFSCIVLGLVTGRWTITRVFPSLTSVYEAAGFPLTNYARLNPEESLIIDRLSFQTEGHKHEIVGSLINLTSQNLKIPLFKVTYLDEKRNIIHESVQSPITGIIQKELALEFRFVIPESAHQNLSLVEISFTEGQKIESSQAETAIH